MKLINFIDNGQHKLGIHMANGVVDVAAAVERLGYAGEIPVTVAEAIDKGRQGLADLRELSGQAAEAGLLVKEEGLRLGPCVPYPNKIICVGLNYRRHAEETNMPIPQYPILFNKFNNALCGHGEDVTLPPVSQKVDYEAELAIVIGRNAKNVAKEEALDYVFGYCAANDLSARDLQMLTGQWLLGKSCDGFAPLGPYLVSADEVGDPDNLFIRCTVNGEPRQDSNTSDMIFACDEIVSYISRHMTLVPGDVILTGTPEGVVLGYPQERQVYLQDGDTVTIEIEKLGSLTNRMVRLEESNRNL